MKSPLTVSVFLSKFKITFFVFIVALISSCNSNDETNPEVDLTTAKLQDFPLSEVERINISIVHPLIIDNVEKASGEIVITIPHAHRSLLLSLKSFELSEEYTVSPSIGEIQDFSKREIVYTLTSKVSTDKKVKYHVRVVYGGEPFFENANITGFRFDVSKNTALTSTIEATKIATYPNYSDGVILVIVPEGTDFTTLIPTIIYDAAKLYYNTGGETKLYPSADITMDFKYPKRFSIQAENSLGVKSKLYHVIVDVKNPIKFEKSTISTPLVKTGDGSGSEVFTTLSTWTNVGNHPITGMSPRQYKNKIYPIIGYTGDANIITTSLSNPESGTVGVLPGEKGHVSVKVMRATKAGLFSTTAIFVPTFSVDTQVISFFAAGDRVEDLFDKTELVIESTLED